MKKLLLALGAALSFLLSGYCLLIAVFFGWWAVTPSFPRERLDEVHFKTDLSLFGVAVFFILAIVFLFFLWRTVGRKSHDLNLK